MNQPISDQTRCPICGNYFLRNRTNQTVTLIPQNPIDNATFPQLVLKLNARWCRGCGWVKQIAEEKLGFTWTNEVPTRK